MNSFQLPAASLWTLYIYLQSVIANFHMKGPERKEIPQTLFKAAFVPSYLAFPTAEVKRWGMSEQTKKHSNEAELHQAALLF